VSLLVQRPDVSEFRKRFRWLTLVVLVAFLAIGARVVQLQLLHSADYQAIAKENIVRKGTLATTRGVIRDKNGKVLAASRPAYHLFVVPKRITCAGRDKRWACPEVDVPRAKVEMAPQWKKLVEWMRMSEVDRLKAEEKLLAIREKTGARMHQQILLKEDLSRDIVAVLETHARELPGIDVVPVSVRYYPAKHVGAHVLGYMREVDREMLVKLRKTGYMEGDRIGATGIERAWESYLRGTRGWEKVVVDARGVRKQGRDSIIDEPRRADPIPGRDLRLTLDVDIQKAMVKAMRPERAGGAALVDVRSGRILGLVSKPSYDPNALSGGNGKQELRAAFNEMYVRNKLLRPALDKTVSGAYPPGSTFKPFTALAALEMGLIDPQRRNVC
jgi:penicillin-binding protein 2